MRKTIGRKPAAPKLDASDSEIPIHAADVSRGDLAVDPAPNVRLYPCSPNVWSLQIRGGLRAATPMFATGLLGLDQLRALRDAINMMLDAASGRWKPPR